MRPGPFRGTVRRMALSTLTIQAYRGFGCARQAVLWGRVYRQPAFGGRYLKRVLRFGLADIEVSATLHGHRLSARTDADGYFRLRWTGLDDVPSGWATVTLEGHDARAHMLGSAEIHMRPRDSSFVVISDIDDTVMDTGVANKFLMYYRLFFVGADRRRAFDGVPAFYQALRHGVSGNEDNPVVFVSRAPWSIHEVLTDFFREAGIVQRAILLLREWGLTLQSPWPRRARDHKKQLIAEVMEVYEDATFVLIGDNGQHDPELYAEFAHTHGVRLRAVYIRAVNRSASRRAQIEGLYRGLATPVVTADTADMARHAADAGLIPAGGGQAT